MRIIASIILVMAMISASCADEPLYNDFEVLARKCQSGLAGMESFQSAENNMTHEQWADFEACSSFLMGVLSGYTLGAADTPRRRCLSNRRPTGLEVVREFMYWYRETKRRNPSYETTKYRSSFYVIVLLGIAFCPKSSK